MIIINQENAAFIISVWYKYLPFFSKMKKSFEGTILRQIKDYSKGKLGFYGIWMLILPKKPVVTLLILFFEIFHDIFHNISPIITTFAEYLSDVCVHLYMHLPDIFLYKFYIFQWKYFKSKHFIFTYIQCQFVVTSKCHSRSLGRVSCYFSFIL